MPGFLRRARPADDKKESGQDILEKVLRGYNACSEVLASMSEAVVVTDGQLVIMGWNHAAETIYGWQAEEALGKKLGDLLSARLPDGGSWGTLLPQILEAGEWQGEVVHRKRDGNKLDIVSSVKVVQNKNEDIAVISINRDLTGQHRTEEQLRWSEEQFHTLADSIPQLVWIADARGEIVWCNRRWVEYTGITLEETHNNGWQKAHHPDYLPRTMERITKAFREGKIWEDVFPLKNKNGQYHMFFTRSVPFSNSHGKAARWMGTNTDISEVRDAQQALKESERKCHHLTDKTSDAYVLFEHVTNFVGTINDLRYTEVNAAFEKITGSLKEEVLGNTISSLFPADTAVFLKHLNQAVETGEPQRFGWHSKSTKTNFTADAFAVKPGFTAVLFRKDLDDIDLA
jgi:PAS domain S-box-containing protein